MLEHSFSMNIQDIRRARLRHLIDSQYSGRQSAFIDRTDINQGELSALLKDKSFAEKKARNIERKAGLESGWLDIPQDSFVGQPRSNYAPSDSKEYGLNIPKLNVRASAGNGVMQFDGEYQIGSISVPEMWVRKNIVCTSVSNLRIITIFGDSMYDTLDDGDLAFVDTGVRKIDRDGVYVADYDGELFIKRFERRPMEQEIWMHSDNKKRHPQHSVISGDKLPMLKVLARAVFAMNGRKL